MSRSAIEELLRLLEQAYRETPEGGGWHSLLANVASLREEDWDWAPRGDPRTVRHIVAHIAGAKWSYENYAFGDGSLTWDEAVFEQPSWSWRAEIPHQIELEDDSTEALLACLDTGHERLRRSIAALPDDSELDRPRPTFRREPRPTRWLVEVMIQHDLYHAGEINQLRLLSQSR